MTDLSGPGGRVNVLGLNGGAVPGRSYSILLPRYGNPAATSPVEPATVAASPMPSPGVSLASMQAPMAAPLGLSLAPRPSNPMAEAMLRYKGQYSEQIAGIQSNIQSTRDALNAVSVPETGNPLALALGSVIPLLAGGMINGTSGMTDAMGGVVQAMPSVIQRMERERLLKEQEAERKRERLDRQIDKDEARIDALEARRDDRVFSAEMEQGRLAESAAQRAENRAYLKAEREDRLNTMTQARTLKAWQDAASKTPSMTAAVRDITEAGPIDLFYQSDRVREKSKALEQAAIKGDQATVYKILATMPAANDKIKTTIDETTGFYTRTAMAMDSALNLMNSGKSPFSKEVARELTTALFQFKEMYNLGSALTGPELINLHKILPMGSPLLRFFDKVNSGETPTWEVLFNYMQGAGATYNIKQDVQTFRAFADRNFLAQTAGNGKEDVYGISFPLGYTPRDFMLKYNVEPEKAMELANDKRMTLLGEYGSMLQRQRETAGISLSDVSGGSFFAGGR